MRKITETRLKRFAAVLIVFVMALSALTIAPNTAYGNTPPPAATDITLVSPPSFTGHAVFDMLDLRGIELEVTLADGSTATWGYSDITPDMISWADNRDLNYRADFMADSALNNVTRTLIITAGDASVEVPVAVQRYAFAAGTRFSIIASSHHPVDEVRGGELRAHFIGPHSTLFAFPELTTQPLGADGKFPADVHPHAVFEIVHNGGNQIGYGILAVDDGRILRTDLGGAFGFWADWDHFPGSASNNLLWRIIRLPNGYHTLVFFNHDNDGRDPRSARPMTAADETGTALPGNEEASWNHFDNPQEWNDPYRWFIINVEYDVETALTAVGAIETDGDINDIRVADFLSAGPITFAVAGNPVANQPIVYQWYRGTSVDGPWTPIAGETRSSYILGHEDYGHYFRVSVVPAGLIIGDAVYSTAVGPVGAGTPWTISSRDIESIRLLEMGWIEIMWRDRMVFDTAAGGDMRITSPDSYRVLINGVQHDIAGINNVRRGDVFMTSLLLEDWQDLFLDWQLNPPHANDNPNNFPWLRPYDVIGDPHDLFTFNDATGLFEYTGWQGDEPGVPLGITLQIVVPLERFGDERVVDTTIVYNVFYTPFYHYISEYNNIWLRQSGNVVDPVTNHERVAAILAVMLSHEVVGDVITEMLVYRGFNTITCGVGENTDHVPEYRGLAVYGNNNPPGGYGPTQINPANYTASGHGIISAGTVIHETAHGIDALALAWLTDHPEYGHIFQYVLDGFAAEFMMAIEQGWWFRTAIAPPGPQPFGTFFSYMMSNRGEFLAVGTDIWFNAFGGLTPNHERPQSREAMYYYHPALFNLFSMIFPIVSMPDLPGDWVGNRSPSDFNEPAPFSFVPNRGATLIDGEIVRDDFSDVLINFGPMFVDQDSLDVSAANIRTSPDGRLYSGQYFTIRHFMGSHIIGGGTIGSQAHTWWDYSHTPWNFQFCGMSWVVREVQGTGEYEGRTFLHFATKGSNPRRGGGSTDTRFGYENEIPGVFGDFGGNALGMDPADNTINSPLTFVEADINDPNQLWYLISFQGRYAQIVNKASGLVISTVNDMNPGDGIFLELIEWQQTPNFGAIWRVMQLKPNPVGGTYSTLLDVRYAIVPHVLGDVKMQYIWIDGNDTSVVWVRWQQPVDDAAAGDITNWSITMQGANVALVQDGTFSQGNLTRLALAQNATAEMLDGLGLRIRFEGNMQAVSGLPVNNQLWYNFRQENWNPADVGTADALFAGMGNVVVGANTVITRAMFVQILANAAGVDTSGLIATAPSFGDVTAGVWHNGALNWAADLRIAIGVDGGNFAPNQPIAREAAAVLLYNFARVTDVQLPQQPANFADAAAISGWALNAVNAMHSIIGPIGGNFAPQGTLTGAEVVEIIETFAQLMP